MSDSDRNNRNYKHIRIAFGLEVADVVEILRLGGVSISKTTANRWGRASLASRLRVNRHSGKPFQDERYKAMTDSEFDAFCAGLVLWAAEDQGFSTAQ